MTMPSRQSKALPPAYVDGLMTRLMGMYGEKFARMWSVSDPKAMRAIWAEELGDLTGAEIKRGLAACMSREWPPTLPEFRNLCRPPLDYESAFHEAARLFGLRNAAWSSPAIYWAAASIGNDVRTLPYKAMVGRWKTALDWALTHRLDEPVPQHDAPQIEDQAGRFVPMPEEVRQQFARFTRKLTGEAA